MIELSIIVPCFNVSNYIGKCLESIIENRTENLQVILVDDGSADDLSGVLENFFGFRVEGERCSFSYKEILFTVIRQNNQGVSAARNRGIAEVQGKYMTFVDPDDYITGNYFETVASYIQRNETDFLLFGFKITELDETGAVTSQWEEYPKEEYCYSSNEEIVRNLVPRYLGISIGNVTAWGKYGTDLAVDKEWGANWRCVYRSAVVKENGIRFNEKIRINEDGMFNARYLVYAAKADTVMHCYYNYISRPTGALRARTGRRLIENKLALLSERKEIVDILRCRGYDFGNGDFAGSNVFSAIENMSKSGWRDWPAVRTYLTDPVVRESVRMMPYVGKIKFDIPLWMLKCRLGRPLFVLIFLMRKMGIQINA